MAAKKKLASYVAVDGVTYGPDDDVPADVAKEITNPKAWGEGGDSESDSGSDAQPAAKKAAAKKSSSSNN